VTLLADEQEESIPRIKALRDRMLAGLQTGCDGIRVNGSMRHRAPHNLSLTIDGVTAEDVLLGMRDIACSTGSACTSETLEPSHVLQALGHPDDARQATVRLGLGRYTTTGEVDYAIARLIETVHNLRGSHDKSAV
jgi:cysteine desulfurase